MEIDKYLKQDINNPIYLFHGSPLKLECVEPRLSHDFNGNIVNISESVFLFPSFLKATPYAFKDTIKKKSNGMDWSFEISNNDSYPLMEMYNVVLDNDMIGYVYVFAKDDDMIKDAETYQYKCNKALIPIDVVEVKYSQYKKYFRVNNKVKKR